MRKKGQHFLVDRGIIERIAGYAKLAPDDSVLEIGPGTGNLTVALAAKAGRVFAVEVDPVLAANLQGRFRNVVVIKGDALKVELPEYNKIVSNLPYQISTKITFRLLSRPFELAVLMYQREFALRMLASPGSENYGRLGMIVGYLCKAEILETVPRSAFRPVPEVESAIVRLRPREHEVDAERFIRLAEGLFNHRRKKIKKALAAMGISKEAMVDVDASLLEKRPEELMPEEAAELAATIIKNKS
ncbi:MAG TPA: 16S rRNA (adenine(1518)-N(6)/adenine(1519)-N(6))-dimethyltransferase RsmA [Methanotrichaceae archaeon]|nr:16S rRNA (adenine(1518)-N(6)/adenine(1519)-N(6))-dimethyltransferase RsmA [Methanotrichaceae archaeon]